MKSDNVKKGIERAPHRSLFKAMGKNVNRTDRFEILYSRDITGQPSPSYSCNDWRDMNALKEDQKALLDEFMSAADKDMTFPQ